MEKRYIDANGEIRADESNEKLTLKGYAIRYNEKSKLLGYGFEEVISKGAFSESLKKRNIIALNNHDTNQLLGTTQANTLRLEDRADGLYFELDLVESRKELYDLVKRGDLAGMSFGFTCSDEEYRKDGNIDIREVKKGELFEISIVHSPAYPSTNVVAKRSLDKYEEFKNNENKEFTENEIRGLELLGGNTNMRTNEIRCYAPGEKFGTNSNITVGHLIRAFATGKGTDEEKRMITSQGASTIIPRCYAPGEKFGTNSNITVGHLIRAFATGKGTDEEKRMITSQGASTIIPEMVSKQLIDLARSKSFLMKNCTIVDMQNHQKVIIPTVKKDPTVAFKQQGQAITASDAEFDKIELDAKYLYGLYGLVEIPLEIIQTGIGVEEKINQLLATVIVSEIEKAALNGAADGFSGIYNERDLLKENITITTGTGYEEITKGISAIAKENGITKNIAMHPTSYYKLQTIITGDGQYRLAPAFYNEIIQDVTTSMGENQILAGDFTQILIGLLKDITIDMSLDYGFGKGTLAVRIMWYGDVKVAKPKHLCLMTVQ